MSDNILEFPNQEFDGDNEDFAAAPTSGYHDPEHYVPAPVVTPINQVAVVPTLQETVHKYVPYIALGLGIFAVYMIMKDR